MRSDLIGFGAYQALIIVILEPAQISDNGCFGTYHTSFGNFDAISLMRGYVPPANTSVHGENASIQYPSNGANAAEDTGWDS